MTLNCILLTALRNKQQSYTKSICELPSTKESIFWHWRQILAYFCTKNVNKRQTCGPKDILYTTKLQ